tara:strand:- start:380 stop:505 length:126 start_codon:yes stop_codon:yes gene_type:complete
MSKEKMLIVDEGVHSQIKLQALMNKMTMKQYVAYLANKDKK